MVRWIRMESELEESGVRIGRMGKNGIRMGWEWGKNGVRIG